MKYSIVVPLYNCERYIERCILSLIDQDYDDYEVIVVNDGSTDSSGEIIASIADELPNFKVVCQQNGGLSSARNTGLRHARGDYVLFIDADDYVESRLLSSIDSHAANQDVILYGYYNEVVDGESNIVSVDQVLFPDPDLNNCFEQMDPLDLSGLIGYAWNKAYRRQYLIENCFHFEEGLSLIEDIDFNGKVIVGTQSVIAIMAPLVHYVQRHRSTSLSNARYGGLGKLCARSLQSRINIFIHYGCGKQILEIKNKLFALLAVYIMSNSSSGLVDTKRELLDFVNSAGLSLDRCGNFPLPVRICFKCHLYSIAIGMYKMKVLLRTHLG